MKCAASMILLVLVATASTAGARPLAAATGVGRHLTQMLPATTTYSVEWDLAFVPYPRVEARCGDLVTFRWEASVPQTVAAVSGESNSAALSDCSLAQPLTEPATSGEYTEELLTQGTIYFVEPTNCGRGQVLVVNVTCEDAAALAVPETDTPPEDVTAAPAPAAFETTAEDAAPAPAPAMA